MQLFKKMSLTLLILLISFNTNHTWGWPEFAKASLICGAGLISCCFVYKLAKMNGKTPRLTSNKNSKKSKVKFVEKENNDVIYIELTPTERLELIREKMHRYFSNEKAQQHSSYIGELFSMIRSYSYYMSKNEESQKSHMILTITNQLLKLDMLIKKAQADCIPYLAGKTIFDNGIKEACNIILVDGTTETLVTLNNHLFNETIAWLNKTLEKTINECKLIISLRNNSNLPTIYLNELENKASLLRHAQNRIIDSPLTNLEEAAILISNSEHSIKAAL